jgi:hypothetical protein
VYSNITVIGPRATTANVGNTLYLAGAQIRRNSSISIFNSVILGFSTGLLIDARQGTPTDNNIAANILAIKNTTIAGCAVPVAYSANASSPTGWNNQAAINWFNTVAFANAVFSTVNDVKLTAPFNYTAPDFTPQAGSPLLGNASFTDTKLAGLVTVNYTGGVGPAGTIDADWWKGWTLLDMSK